jgi:AI-2 transport protein TqsA
MLNRNHSQNEPGRVMNTNLREEQVWLVVGSLMIVAAVTAATALVYTREVMIPFVLAIFITMVVSPVVDFQVLRWRLPSWIAISSALLVVLAILALLGVVLIISVQTIVRAAGEYSERVVELSQRLFTELNAHHIEVDQTRISSELQSRLPQIITEAAGTVSAVFSSGFLILIFVVFLLVGRNPRLRRGGIYAEIEATIRGYITTKTLISAATGLLVGLILWMLGLRMSMLFGILAFLLNFIPSIGSIIATLLPIPVAVAQFEDPWMILAVVGLPGTVHTIIGTVVEPRLMGRGLELHPVTVLLALAFWGLLWGIMGMVLAVPLAATLRIVLGQFATTRSLSELLAGRLPGGDSVSVP